MYNKRGQELSTSAIILIVLGIIVLVVLALGFYLGWDKIVPWIKPSNNVDDIKSSCELVCSMGKTYDFCTINRDLFDESGKFSGSCSTFAKDEKYKKYGIAECPAITCPAPTAPAP